jgi:hypothetical protein
VVARRSTSGGHGVSVLESVTSTAVVGRTHFRAKTVSLALLMSSTSLLSGSKNFFNNIRIVNMSCDLRCLIFSQFIGN